VLKCKKIERAKDHGFKEIWKVKIINKPATDFLRRKVTPPKAYWAKAITLAGGAVHCLI
jgi:hypothetical protein